MGRNEVEAGEGMAAKLTRTSPCRIAAVLKLAASGRSAKFIGKRLRMDHGTAATIMRREGYDVPTSVPTGDPTPEEEAEIERRKGVLRALHELNRAAEERDGYRQWRRPAGIRRYGIQLIAGQFTYRAR